MAPSYSLSSFGQYIVIDEGTIEQPWLRYSYLAVNVLLFLIPTILITKQFLTQRIRMSRTKSLSSSLWLITSLLVTYIANNLIRTCYMVDHSYRPVYYYEPELGYQKYLIVEMELGTYSNLVFSSVGYYGFTKLTSFVFVSTESPKKQKNLPRISCLVLNMAYVIGAIGPLIHYTIESPWNFGPFPNFNIAGSSISGVLYLGFVIYSLYIWSPGKSGRKSESSGGGGGGRATRSATKRSSAGRK